MEDKESFQDIRRVVRHAHRWRSLVFLASDNIFALEALPELLHGLRVPYLKTLETCSAMMFDVDETMRPRTSIVVGGASLLASVTTDNICLSYFRPPGGSIITLVVE
jgi:hypothetical protein